MNYMEIVGTAVQLEVKTEKGKDALNHAVYEKEWVTVEDVLIGEPSADDISNSLSLYGKKVAYVLAIPKGDTHVWEDAAVILPEPFVGEYKVIGFPTAGIEANLPLRWNKKVLVERYG